MKNSDFYVHKEEQNISVFPLLIQAELLIGLILDHFDINTSEKSKHLKGMIGSLSVSLTINNYCKSVRLFGLEGATCSRPDVQWGEAPQRTARSTIVSSDYILKD